jgi:hypothetical protein
MSDINLAEKAAIELSVGHLLLVWHVLSDKLSGSPLNEAFSEEEKRAIWALEDLCEDALTASGVTSKPQNEWDRLIDMAREHVKTISVEFLD